MKLLLCFLTFSNFLLYFCENITWYIDRMFFWGCIYEDGPNLVKIHPGCCYSEKSTLNAVLHQVCQKVFHTATKDINMDKNKTTEVNVLAATRVESLKFMTHPSVFMLQMATHELSLSHTHKTHTSPLPALTESCRWATDTLSSIHSGNSRHKHAAFDADKGPPD